MATNYRFVVKRDTVANFTAANTLLLSGEFGLELDTGRAKMGDGVTQWNSLGHYAIPGRFDLTGLANGDVMVWDAVAGKFKRGTAGGVASIVPGANVTVDDTDPANPIVSAVSGSAATATATATEALAAGQFVNFHSGGVRLAKAAPGFEAHGFVLSAFASSATAIVYLPGGVNTSLAGLSLGASIFLSITPGQSTMNVTLYGAGALIQRLGTAVGTTSATFNPAQPIERT